MNNLDALCGHIGQTGNREGKTMAMKEEMV
jgi:hypothetical protein